MVRIAFISDVHSNLEALTSVMEALRGEGLDATVSLGDVVGYGAEPNECCDIVARWARHSVVGNHDLAALKRDPSRMNPFAGEAILWTAEHMSERGSVYLSSMSDSARFSEGGLTFDVHHGSLESVWEYLYEEDLSPGMLDSAEADVLAFGHTHVPCIARYRRGLIINPGSVGQPRDGDPRASFAVLETSPLSCRIVRVEYDIERAADHILRAGLPEMLASRLSRGY